MNRLGLAVILASSLACTKASPKDDRELDPPAGDRASTSTLLRGTLLDHHGQPMRLANVELIMPGQESVALAVAVDGSFELMGPARGFAQLRATGVDHADFRMGMLLDGQTHDLKIELGTYPRPPSFAALTGFAHFGDPQQRLGLEFVRREDGKWQARIERDATNANVHEVHYQLANTNSVGHTTNGTQADRWIYDGGGDYWSVVSVGAGPIVIEFDPAALPPAEQPTEIEFGVPESEFARVTQTLVEIDQWQQAAWASAGEVGLAHESFMGLRALLVAAARELDEPVRGVILIAWAGILDPEHASAEDRERVRELLALVGPADPRWSSDPGAAGNALALVDAPEFRSAMLADHADARISFALWMRALDQAERARDRTGASEAIAALREPRHEALGGAMWASMYDPDRPTAPGKPVPEFRLRSLDGKTSISAESLRGKTYVIEFWATWCAPCIAAMPLLHSSHAELTAKPSAGLDFEVLSVSMDDSTTIVDEFRAGRWTMPWLHAHVGPAEHAALTEQFGINGIPMMVLVGPDKTILASTPTLETANLVELVRGASAQ